MGAPVSKELMKTIFFTNRERIMIGDDTIEYMTYLQKKLPAANYIDTFDVSVDQNKPDTPPPKKQQRDQAGTKSTRYLS